MLSVEVPFLDALHCRNRGRPPVWLMRQAGRYMPAYRALRAKHSLRELFFTPELAAQVTLMPVHEFGVDAAILFSDIAVVALSLGLKLDFQEGPVIEPLLGPADVAELAFREAKEVLAPIGEAIRLIKPNCPVPLIGFCGGPFTVASYLIEKHAGSDLPQTKKWLYRDPDTFAKLLDRICESSIDYLKMQIESGVDAVQIFDSWAHVLSKEHFQRFCAPYLKRMIDSLDVPATLFMRGSSTRAQELSALTPSAISFDWQRPLAELRKEVPPSIALQGNLDPDLLYAPLPVIQKTVRELIASMRGDPGFIVNLGHGVKPDVPVEAVRCLVDSVVSGLS